MLGLFNYFILYFAYLSGGIYFIYRDVVLKSIFFGLLLLIAFFKGRLLPIEKNVIITFTLLTILFISQKLIFGLGSIYNLAGLFVIFGTPYMVLKVLKLNVITLFIKIIYFFSIISITFWVLSNAIPSFINMTSNLPTILGTDIWLNQSYLIYSTRINRSLFGLIRNNGGFWEPGAYATTLVLGLIFGMIKEKNLFEKKNRVIVLAILTTFSTTGYIALFLIYLNHINLKRELYNLSFDFVKNRRIIAFVVLFPLLFAIESVGEKTVGQINDAINYDLNDATSGRFVSALKSLNGIAENPLIGRYLIYDRENFEDFLYRDDVGMYGFLWLIQRIGVPLFILFVYFIHIGFKTLLKANGNYSLISQNAKLYTLIWLVLMFAQNLYWTPISLIVFWVGINANTYLFKLNNSRQSLSY